MSFQVTLQPGAHQFAASADETLLQSALAAGLLLPYSCRDGACGVCKGKVVSGRVDLGRYSESSLTASERAQGMALMCCARPLTDLELEVRQVNLVGEIPVKKMPCRVQKLQRLCDDVIVLDLKLPASERFQFRAGQYIDFLLADGKRRSFSIANAPHDDQFLQLHIRRSPNGAFSEYVFTQMKERAILRIEGPLGTFFMREESDKPIIFLAGGTGFAPIKAIIEHLLAKGSRREMVLYWGVRSLSDLYLPQLPGEWQQEHSNFTFIPVLSEPRPEDAWQGRVGFVHDAVLQDFPDLTGYAVYACGGPAMINIAQQSFFARGLPEEEFYCDSFTPAVDPKAAATP